MGLSSYEEHRQKRVDENKKRSEELNLVHLSQSPKNLSPKPSPMKKSVAAKSRTVVTIPAPVYADVGMSGLSLPRRSSNYGIGRGAVWNGVLATHADRERAIEKAKRLVANLEQDGFPTLIRPLLPTHVSSCFWLGLPKHFCTENLPTTDTTLTMVDEKGDEFPTIYLPRESGLSGGWRDFAIEKGLNDGDAVVFQLISPSVLKVYVIRATDQEAGEDLCACSPTRFSEPDFFVKASINMCHGPFVTACSPTRFSEPDFFVKASINTCHGPFVTAAGWVQLSNNSLPADGLCI